MGKKEEKDIFSKGKEEDRGRKGQKLVRKEGSRKVRKGKNKVNKLVSKFVRR